MESLRQQRGEGATDGRLAGSTVPEVGLDVSRRETVFCLTDVERAVIRSGSET